MIGYVEAPRAWWMAQGMARASGVQLARAVVEGWLTRGELAQLVGSCESCGKTCDCREWLAEPHAAPPDFCRIGPDIAALAPGQPG